MKDNLDDTSRFVCLINIISCLFLNDTERSQSEFLQIYSKKYGDGKTENTFFKIVFEQMLGALYLCINPFPKGRVWLSQFLIVKFCMIFFKNSCEDNNSEIKELLRKTIIIN